MSIETNSILRIVRDLTRLYTFCYLPLLLFGVKSKFLRGWFGVILFIISAIIYIFLEYKQAKIWIREIERLNQLILEIENDLIRVGKVWDNERKDLLNKLYTLYDRRHDLELKVPFYHAKEGRNPEIRYRLMSTYLDEDFSEVGENSL